MATGRPLEHPLLGWNNILMSSWELEKQSSKGRKVKFPSQETIQNYLAQALKKKKSPESQGVSGMELEFRTHHAGLLLRFLGGTWFCHETQVISLRLFPWRFKLPKKRQLKPENSSGSAPVQLQGDTWVLAQALTATPRRKLCSRLGSTGSISVFDFFFPAALWSPGRKPSRWSWSRT